MNFALFVLQLSFNDLKFIVDFFFLNERNVLFEIKKKKRIYIMFILFFLDYSSFIKKKSLFFWSFNDFYLFNSKIKKIFRLFLF